MCHSLGPLARGLLFIQLAFYSNTSTPHPQYSGTRLNFGRDTKVQLKTPFSHLEHPIARGQEKGMRVEAKQVISPNKPSKSATRRVLELGMILSKARRGKLRQREVARRDPRSLRGCGRIRSRTGVASCPESAGPGPWVPALSGAAGRSWPQPPPRLAPSRDRLAPPHVPGPGPWAAPRRPHPAPAAALTGSLSQRRGQLPIPRRPPRFFRSGTTAPPRRSGRRRLPRGAGGPGPARKPSPRTAAAAAEAAPRGGPLAGSSGALAGARAERGGGGRRRGWALRPPRAHARVPVPVLSPRPGAAGARRAVPSPADFLGPSPWDFGKPLHPGSLRSRTLQTCADTSAQRCQGGWREAKSSSAGQKQAASLSAASRCPHCPWMPSRFNPECSFHPGQRTSHSTIPEFTSKGSSGNSPPLSSWKLLFFKGMYSFPVSNAFDGCTRARVHVPRQC